MKRTISRSKNVTYTRNFSVRAHSAVHSRNNGPAQSIKRHKKYKIAKNISKVFGSNFNQQGVKIYMHCVNLQRVNRCNTKKAYYWNTVNSHVNSTLLLISYCQKKSYLENSARFMLTVIEALQFASVPILMGGSNSKCSAFTHSFKCQRCLISKYYQYCHVL